LEKELKTVVVDKEKLKRELKECENTVTECRDKIQQLEDQLQSKQDELSNIQQVYKIEQQTNKDHVTRQEQLTIEIQNLEQTNKDLQHKLAITEETQRVLEYIISKASPELAKTVMQELRQLQQ
jgi:chromosome segregation ATPase